MLSNRYIPALKQTVLIILCLVAVYVCFYKLGVATLDDWDEAWYGEITKQMLRTGEYVVSQWNRQLNFDKPPLYMWLSAFFASFLGLSEFSLRLTSGISAVATIILALWYSYKKWGLLPSFLTFCTLTLNSVYIWRVRSGNVDALVTFLIFATFLVLVSRYKYKYPLLGLLYACIFLTKASLVFFPLLILGSHELLFERKNIKQNFKPYLMAIALFVMLVGGWLLAGWMKAGPGFLNYFLFQSDQGVTKLSLEYAKLEYLKYTYFSLQRRFFFVLAFGWLLMFFDLKKRENFLMLFYSIFLLATLSFTLRNNNWYLLPSMPFWSLIIGYATYRILYFKPKFAMIVGILILMPTVYVSQKTYRENIVPIFSTGSSYSHSQTAKKIQLLSGYDEVIVRLDPLYPSTIYYADRKILSSPEGEADGYIYISRDTLAKDITTGKLRWVIGKKSDVEGFQTKYTLDGELINVNEDEMIFKGKSTQ